MRTDGQTDGMDGWMDGRKENAKTISLRLRKGIKSKKKVSNNLDPDQA